jgi:signal transduction histidine kinase/ActR/RegA family two-component response regulator
VTFTTSRGKYFYLQDATGGVRVEWGGTDRQLKPGEQVRVAGVTTAGTFLPEVKGERVEPAPGGPRELPAPAPYTLTMDDAPYLDGRFVEVVAVAQVVKEHEGWLQFDLARGRGGATAYVPLPLPARVKEAMKSVGAVVRLRGVCRVNPNAARQQAGPPRILVNDLGGVEVITPPRRDPFATPLSTARELSLFRPDPVETRLPARVEGVVTLNLGNRQFYVHDGTGVVQAICTADVKVMPGDRVEVVGYPRPPADLVRFDHARVRRTGAAHLPPPQPATVAQARDGKLEGSVVKFAALVHESGRQGKWMTLTLVAEGLSFTVVILEAMADDAPPPAAPGSKVEVTGVVTKLPLDGVRRTAFALMVHPDGLAVLEVPAKPPEPPAPPAPSWWTGRRVAFLSAGFFGLFVLGGATVTALRLQVRRATALVRKQYEEKERLEGQLKLAAKLEAVGRLAGGIAHDFNNLLTVINGCAQLLDEEIANDPGRAAVLANQIQRAGGQAAALTRQLLTFSRQRAVTPHPLDLNTAVTEAATILARLMGERVELRVVVQPDLPPAMAESGLLSQILLNFAVNARDAMPAGGTFTLATAHPEPGWVRLSATDTGLGMSDEVKAHIFEPFYTTKEVGKGTGLGLSTVYGIVQTLGGKIRFLSELGRGTTFEVDLPVARTASTAGQTTMLAPVRLTPASDADAEVAAETPPPRVAAVPTPPNPIGPAVVVLVEDDDAVRSLVRAVLEQSGLTVLSANEPAEALRLLTGHSGQVDLLITDVMMPGLSGRELAERARAERPGLRVLFMSGYTSDEVLLQGVREDQVEFLHKPFAPRDLLARVRQILSQPPRDPEETQL